MESVGVSVTNATLGLVRDMEVYFEQSEKTATVEVGVAIGVIVSVCIMLCLCCSAKVCMAANKGDSHVVACCKPSARDIALESGHDDEEEGYNTSSPGGGGVENAPSAVGTEGAYRSDSDSDDEGEGAKVSREAQRRARCASGI
jgi:hypothetical protein